MGLIRKKERGKEKIGNSWGYTFGNEIFFKILTVSYLFYTLIVVEGEKGESSPARLGKLSRIIKLRICTSLTSSQSHAHARYSSL
jgi:hypothetical protein